MLCAICLYVVVNKLDPAVVEPAPAVTAINGTSLCATHAMEKTQNADVLQDLGLR